jgi:hypothetical protein
VKGYRFRQTTKVAGKDSAEKAANPNKLVPVTGKAKPISAMEFIGGEHCGRRIGFASDHWPQKIEAANVNFARQ